MIGITNLANGIKIGSRYYPPNCYNVINADTDDIIKLTNLENSVNVEAAWQQFEDETQTPFPSKQAVIDALLLNNDK